MDIIAFLGIKECEQWEIFDSNAEFYGEIISIDAHYQLYRLEDFCVELTMVPDTLKALRMDPMLTGPRLDKYFESDIEVSKANSLIE